MGRNLKDVTGEKYNMLTITGNAPTKITEKGRYKRVYTICDCGNTGESSYRDVKRGKVKSCGCLKPVAANLEPGTKIHNWTVLREAKPYISKGGTTKNKVWVKCKCGKEVSRIITSILKGDSKSCGCRGVEKIEKITYSKPVDTNKEKWVNLLDSDIHWVSSLGRRYIQSHGKYYNLSRDSGYHDLEKGFYWWAKAIYKSFNGEWNTKKYKLCILDGKLDNLNLNNFYLAERTSSRGNPDWITYLQGNTRRSNRDGEISKVRLLELYKQQKGKSYYFGIEMDLTCSNDLLAISVDRIDNSRGYIDDNVVLCTRFENIGRRHNSVQDMKRLVNIIKKS